MKKLISTLTLAILMLSMTTFALAAPATQNSSYTGFSVVTGSGCTQSNTDSSTDSSAGSIYDYLKSLGINFGSNSAQDSTSNSNCNPSNDASDTSDSDTTYGTPNCNTASNATGTQQATAPQDASDTTTSDAAASDTTSSETAAGTANTSDTAVEAASDSSSTCNDSTCAANSTCVGGSCAADNDTCTSGSTCSGGSCAADSASNTAACNVGTTYNIYCANSSTFGCTLSELLDNLRQRCTTPVNDTSDDQSEATPVPTSDSGTIPGSGTTPDAETTPDSGTSPTDNTDSGTTPSDNSANLSYEEQVAVLVNEQRVANGLEPLIFSAELSNVARAKSQDMHDNNYFAHTSPTYGSPFDMLKAFGISYRSAGENIAMGYATPEEVVTAWMNSAGHRANILSSSYTQIGVGYIADGNYWTQEFIG